MKSQPKRVKKCANCRQKKVKCDNELPRCGACVLTNSNCQPYKEEFQFVVRTPATQAASQAASQKLPKETTAVVMRRPQQPRIRRNPFTAPTIARLTVASQFCSLVYPMDKKSWNSSQDWILSAMGSSSPGLGGSSVAMAALFLSRSHKDESMRFYSLNMYSAALMKLRNLASVSIPQNLLELLRVTILCNMYEEYTYVPGVTWDQMNMKSHCFGMESLLRLAGPAAFRREPLHGAFLDVREHLLRRDGLIYTPSMINDPEWMTIPWTFIPKTMEHRCFDVFSMLSAVRQRIIKPCSGVELVDPVTGVSRCADCVETQKDVPAFHMILDKWEADLKTEFPHLADILSLPWRDTGGFRDTYQKSPEAIMMVRHCALRLWLHWVYHKALQKPSKLCHVDAEENRMKRDGDHRRAVECILGTTFYMLGPGMGASNYVSTYEPLILSQRYCDRTPGLEEVSSICQDLHKRMVRGWEKDMLITAP